MTDRQSLMQLWIALSRKVLACVLFDAGAVFPVLEIVKHNAKWFSPKERPIYQAVLACVETDVLPTVEAVAAKLNGAVDISYIMQIASLFNDDDNAKLIYHTQQLKEVGILVKVKQLGKQLNEISSPDLVAETLDGVNTELVGLFADKNNRSADATDVDREAWGNVEKFKGSGIPTGLTWFDTLTGGLWGGMNYWIAAAYKSGKTTVMRNMILTAAKAGHSVAAYCAEGTRAMFALDCQAMIAVKIMMDQGVKRQKCRLSGLYIMQSWVKHRDKPIFSEMEYNAIQEARKIWSSLPIKVYDTRDGIRDLATLQYNIKRDKMKSNTTAAFLDYSQLFGRGNTLFERQSSTALRVQEIAQNENVAMVTLAQLNESSIRDNNSYSVGVKGGGDASAAADFLLVPSIDPDTPFTITIKLKFSRHTRTGQGMHLIETSSGLITGTLPDTPAPGPIDF